MIRLRNTIQYGSLDEIAERIYYDMPGSSEEGLEIGKQFCEGKLIKLMYLTFEEEDVHNKRMFLKRETLHVDDANIICNDFVNIKEQGLLGARFYLFSSEDMDSTGDMLDDYYIHMWQTAYMDAARETIKEQLYALYQKEGRNVMVTESYGPGFYGMDTAQIEQFYSLLKGEEIGVTLHGQMMNPIKSCTGLYLVVEESAYQKSLPCQSCQFGGHCELCTIGKRIH